SPARSLTTTPKRSGPPAGKSQSPTSASCPSRRLQGQGRQRCQLDGVSWFAPSPPLWGRQLRLGRQALAKLERGTGTISQFPATPSQEPELHPLDRHTRQPPREDRPRIDIDPVRPYLRLRHRCMPMHHHRL